MYEPYVEVCRRLDELWPGDAATKIAARQLGRRGDRERREDRARRDRPRRRRRLRPRLPRPHEPDDGDDVEARLQAGLRAARDRRLPRAGAVPVPRRHDRGRARTASSCSSSRTSTRPRSRASCSSRCRARAASSRCRRTFVAGAEGALRAARDPLRRRRGAVRLRPHRARCGRSSTTASSPTCSSRASRSAAGCRSRA